MSTIRSVLDEAARKTPDKPLFVFPGTRWNGSDVLTYGDLAARAAAAANVLRDIAAPGERAVLLFATGAAFWEAFVGCLASGVIAVPLPAPGFSHGVNQLETLCQDCRPTVLVTDESTAELVRRRSDPNSLLARLPAISPASWRNERTAIRWDEPPPSATAFLQYTSGSTAEPKGIQVCHGNVLANLAMIPAPGAPGWRARAGASSVARPRSAAGRRRSGVRAGEEHPAALSPGGGISV